MVISLTELAFYVNISFIMALDISMRELPQFADDPKLVGETASLIVGGLGARANPDPSEVREQILRTDQNMAVVALEAGRVIATGALSSPEDWLYSERRLLDLVVAEGYRGEGIGRRVVHFLETKAREAHDRELFVVSVASARTFYRGLGFRVHHNNTLVKDL